MDDADALCNLLRGNEPLTDIQARHAESQIELINNCIMEVDMELDTILRHYQLLRTRRKDLLTLKRSYTKILSPLRSLPSEILTHIFRYVVYPVKNNESRMLERDNRLPITTQVVTLARVCKRWSQIVHGTPSLWCEVEVDERMKGMDMWKLVGNLKKHYARAGTMPWTLSFSSEHHLVCPRNSIPSLPLSSDPLVAFLKGTSKWKSLALDHRHLDILYPLFSNDPNFSEEYSWPELESLYLKGWYYGPAIAEPFINTSKPVYMGSMPRLTSLSLYTYDQSISNWKMPWHQLTILRLTSADSYIDFMQVLRRCPNLQTCELSLPPTANPSAVERDQVLASHICLPELERLQISHSTVIWPFFSAVTFPALKRLVVSTPPGTHGRCLDNPAGKALSDFLTRSKCKLETLALDNIPLQDEDYIDIVTQSPDLLSLRITDHANAGFWVDTINKKNLLPNVSHVVWHGHFEEGTYVREYLEEFLESRFALGYDEDGVLWGDEMTFSEEIFEWAAKHQRIQD